MKYVPEKLGVSIASSKTHVSPHFCEFAKRYFYKGEEISAFPVSALRESKKSFYLLYNLVEEMRRKNFPFSLEGAEVVSEYYGVVDSKSRSYRKKILDRTNLFEVIYKFTNGQLSGVGTINALFTKLRLPMVECSSEINCLKFLWDSLTYFFEESMYKQLKANKAPRSFSKDTLLESFKIKTWTQLAELFVSTLRDHLPYQDQVMDNPRAGRLALDYSLKIIYD